MEPIHEFTVIWATRPEARKLQAVHHSMRCVENEETAKVSESVVVPLRCLLSMIDSEKAKEAVAVLDEMIQEICKKNGIDRMAEMDAKVVERARILCDGIATEYAEKLTLEGKQLLPSVEIEVPAIIASSRRDRENQRGKLRLRE